MKAKAVGIACAVLLAGTLLLSGCASREASPEFIFGLAPVLTIDVRVDQGLPARVNAVVRGIVRDSCTRIDSVRQSLEDRVFSLTLTTRRPITADECRDAEMPFEATVPLVVRGLRPGDYTVTAGGVSATFRLAAPEIAPPL